MSQQIASAFRPPSESETLPFQVGACSGGHWTQEMQSFGTTTIVSVALFSALWVCGLH
jgi:hypothetical protein